MTRPLALLALTVTLMFSAGTAPAEAVEAHHGWGKVSAGNTVLKAGCRDYPYRYEVTAPGDGDWSLEVRLVAPKGRTVWFGYLYEGANPAAGRATFRLCRSAVTPGVYRLKSVVSVQDFAAGEQKGRLRTDRFRLR